MRRVIVILLVLLFVWRVAASPARTTTEIVENRRHEGRWYTSVIAR